MIFYGVNGCRHPAYKRKTVFSCLDFRESSKSGSRLLFLNQVLKLVMSYPTILMMLFFISMDPVLFLSSTFLSILIWSSFLVLFYAKKI